MAPHLIPLKQLAEDGELQARRNAQAIAQSSPWLRGLSEELLLIEQQGGALRARHARMLRLADRIAAAIAPQAACSKGCSACCHIAVSITQFEAERLGQAIGQRPAKLPARVDAQAGVKRHFGTPCPFLADGACSIYAHRPIACRLHANISDTNFFCDTNIAPEDSRVPNLDLRTFWVSFALQFASSPSADIRDFFPGKARA